MKKQQILLYCFLSILFLLQFQANALVSLQFHEDIVAGKTYNWKVYTFGYSGDLSLSSVAPKIGSDNLDAGDTITVKILKTPNQLNGSNGWQNEHWMNVSVNDVDVIYDSSLIYSDESTPYFIILPLDVVDVFGVYYDRNWVPPIWPIYPVIYSNDSGSYDFFDVMAAEYKQDEVHQNDVISDSWDGGYFEGKVITTVEYTLSDKQFETYIYIDYRHSIHNTNEGTESYYNLQLTEYIRINRETGLLNQVYFKMSGETNEAIGTTLSKLVADDVTNVDLELDIRLEGYTPSKGNSAAFEPIYAIMGISVITLIIKKKKGRK